jgi:hypothetical protein
MSAVNLRLAARRIRHDVDFDQAHGDAGFLLAVADWLEDEATWADAGEQYDPAIAVARAYLGDLA